MKTLAPFIRPSRRILCGSITALVVAMGFSALRADTQTWTPGSALWDLNAANWNGGAVWSNGNDALFESSGTAFQSLTLGTGVQAGNLTFGASGYSITGGSLTLIGNVRPRIEQDLQGIVSGELTVRGSSASAGEYPDCIERIADGRLRVTELISRTQPLEDGLAAFEALHRGEPGLMRIVLHPSGR